MKPTHTPRHQFGAPAELWDAFKRKHGKRGASRRLRQLIEADLKSTGPSGTQSEGPAKTTTREQANR